MNNYKLYKPNIMVGTIYSGTHGHEEFAYNHMVSLSCFDNQFYAAWGANPNTNREGQPGQCNVVSTSKDFIRWSTPQDLTGPELSENPIPVNKEVFWQPELLNFFDRELWCLWSFGKEPPFNWNSAGWGNAESGKGLYLSRKFPGELEKWRHKKIMDLVEIDGFACAPFISQNPFICSDGRIIAPLTFSEGRNRLFEDDPVTMPYRWNACAWTDDEGETWHLSNPISRVDDPSAQWEPHFWEQKDGRIRGIMRNFDPPELRKTPLPPVERQLTIVSEPTKRGLPIKFKTEPVHAFVETGRTRCQTFRISNGSRFCMLGSDSYTPWGGRNQLAMYFSRTGTMDFVAGNIYNVRHEYSTYSQGIEKDGNLYLGWTTTENKHSQWHIKSAIVYPAPLIDENYIWPRVKAIQEENWIYPPEPSIKTIDNRQAIHIRMRGSGGVEIDSVDFYKNQNFNLSMEIKILKVQKQGNLVLFSFGDKIPIRVGIPSFRPDHIYAYGYDEWQKVGKIEKQKWIRIEFSISREIFSVRVGTSEKAEFLNPITAPNPRLYIGDGYELDHHFPSNNGSEFFIDIDTVETSIELSDQ
jgi:hypothetical protein